MPQRWNATRGPTMMEKKSYTVIQKSLPLSRVSKFQLFSFATTKPLFRGDQTRDKKNKKKRCGKKTQIWITKNWLKRRSLSMSVRNHGVLCHNVSQNKRERARASERCFMLSMLTFEKAGDYDTSQNKRRYDVQTDRFLYKFIHPSLTFKSVWQIWHTEVLIVSQYKVSHQMWHNVI